MQIPFCNGALNVSVTFVGATLTVAQILFCNNVPDIACQENLFTGKI